MVIGFIGATGSGKSYFSKKIANRFNKDYGTEYMALISTREPRHGENNNSDKIFVSREQFRQLENKGLISGSFEMLGYLYGYETEKLKSNNIYITEVQYDQIDIFRQAVNNTLLIYLMPIDIETAKEMLRRRKLPQETQEARITDIDEHIKKFYDKNLAKEYDYVVINDYTEGTLDSVADIVREYIERTTKRRHNVPISSLILKLLKDDEISAEEVERSDRIEQCEYKKDTEVHR